MGVNQVRLSVQLRLVHISTMKVYNILLLTMVGMALSIKGNEVDTDLEMEEQGISAREDLTLPTSIDEDRKVNKCGKKCKPGEECRALPYRTLPIMFVCQKI